MSLKIKSQEAHDPAAELSRLTGESMTKAVAIAIRERLERQQRRRDKKALVAELLAIARRVASYPRKDRRSHGEFLYGDRGLPRSND